MNDETCKKYISIDNPECGDPATGSVETKKKARVPLCTRHLAEYKNTMARLRKSGKLSA